MPVQDLLLKGGHVIDARNGVDEVSDVLVRGGKIASVANDVEPDGAKTIDVSGMYVTPGLVDLHTHTFGYFASTAADEYAFPNGVTTIVDAGGAGYKTFERFRRRVVERAQVRLLALVNIVAGGMRGAVEQDVSEMQPRPIPELMKDHGDIIVGVKAAHYGGPEWASVDGAVQAAEMTGTVAMIDYRTHADRTYRELILEHLRPGDMHTHMYGRHIAQIDEDGTVRDYIWQARERGVLFDLGHGGGSFWFRVARPCMEQGHVPDTISTDIHKGSFFIPRATMPNCMSKLMNLGMSLSDAIEKSTSAPALNIKRPELGTLSVGADADVAVFELQEGEFGFVDSGRARMKGTSNLVCHMTIMGGEVMWDLNGLAAPDYEGLGDYYRADDPSLKVAIKREEEYR